MMDGGHGREVTPFRITDGVTTLFVAFFFVLRQAIEMVGWR